MYLNNHGLLSANQSGLRAFHSTLTALIKNTDDWYSGMDLGKYVGTVFVDLKKAFGTVDHSILLQKLYHYEAQDLDLKWFESYLSNRKQFTRIDGVDINTNGTRHKQAALKNQVVTPSLYFCDAPVEVAENINYLGVVH